MTTASQPQPRPTLMQYFDRDGKHNFVDEDNNFLGYDSRQDCCERASWFVSTLPQITTNPRPPYHVPDDAVCWANYKFDTDYFRDATGEVPDAEDGGLVIFKLIARDGKDVPDLYLHLFNCHNGYYGHGFEFFKGVKIQGGYL